MSALLDLNDALGTLREDPAATDNVGAAPLCSPPVADDAEEETGHPEQPASGRQAGDSTQLLPTGRGDSKQRQRLHQQQLLGSQRIQKGLQNKRTCWMSTLTMSCFCKECRSPSTMKNERVQKIKTSKKITYRASLSTVEGSGDENDPLTTTVAAKPNKPIKENPLFAKLEESNTAIRELTGT
ncbi:hypothetical protein L3Q82_025603, partial [Scortum barcoo]